MSLVTRKIWKCDECGHEWIPEGEGKPERCPRRKCRSSKWDREIVEAIREAEGKAVSPAKVAVVPSGPTVYGLPRAKSGGGARGSEIEDDASIDKNFDFGA